MCTENLSVSWCARVFGAAGLQCWGTLLTSCSSLKTGLIALVDSNRVVFRITTEVLPSCLSQAAGQARLTWALLDLGFQEPYFRKRNANDSVQPTHQLVATLT